jgi:type VI secretion system protein ImpH
MGTRGLRGRLAFRDESLVFYSGLLAQRPRSASALRGILEDYFQVGVEIVQCVGAWLTLATDDRCHLNSAGVRNRLGVGAVLGDQVWDPQGQLLVRLGPMSRQRFVAFVPGAPASAVLVEWIRFVVGPALRLVVNPVPIASEVPSVRLGDDGPLATHLGWDSWLDAEDFEGDALDAEFSYAS